MVYMGFVRDERSRASTQSASGLVIILTSEEGKIAGGLMRQHEGLSPARGWTV